MRSATDTDTDTLDTLAAAVTAFRGWAELLAALEGGYVPTLTPYRGRGRAVAAENARRARLATAVVEAGYRVWVGN